MSGGGTASLGGGITQTRSLRLSGGGTTSVRLQAVVPLSTSGGTARTPKFWRFEFWLQVL